MLPWTAWVRWCPPVLLLSWSWFSHSLCADVLSLNCPYMFFRISMCTSSIPWSCNDINVAWVCTESNAFSYNPRKQHTVVCCIHGTLLFKLVYGIYVICRRVAYLLLNPACSLGWRLLWTHTAFWRKKTACNVLHWIQRVFKEPLQCVTLYTNTFFK